jgi:hypothetical protein
VGGGARAGLEERDGHGQDRAVGCGWHCCHRASFFFSLWIFSQTSAEFTEYFNGKIDKWAAIIKAANVKPEQ